MVNHLFVNCSKKGPVKISGLEIRVATLVRIVQTI